MTDEFERWRTLLGLEGPARERILTATEATLEDVGYSKARLEPIAERAAVSRQTIYDYFGSRDGLLRAFMASEVFRFSDLMKAQVRESPDLFSSLESTFSSLLTFLFARRSTSDPLRRDFVVFAMTKAEEVFELQSVLGAEAFEELGFPHDRAISAGSVATRLLFSVVAVNEPGRRPEDHASDIARAVVGVLRVKQR